MCAFFACNDNNSYYIQTQQENGNEGTTEWRNNREQTIFIGIKNGFSTALCKHTRKNRNYAHAHINTYMTALLTMHKNIEEKKSNFLNLLTIESFLFRLVLLFIYLFSFAWNLFTFIAFFTNWSFRVGTYFVGASNKRN